MTLIEDRQDEQIVLSERVVTQVGVLLIHGIGQSNTDYSTKFRKRLKKHLQRAYKMQEPHDVCFEEVFWGSITKSGQSEVILNNEIYATVGGIWPLPVIRRPVLRNLADAAAYQDLDASKRRSRRTHYSPNSSSELPESSFQRIQDSIRRSMANLSSRVGPNSPLIVVAHSFGGQVISSYISDIASSALEDNQRPQNAFEKFETLAGIVTIGCNIPAFAFSQHPSEVIPVRVPARSSSGLTRLCNEQGIRTWLNYFNTYDVLGFPLRTINEMYNNAVADLNIPILPTLNIAKAHTMYWRNNRIIRDTAHLILLARLFGEPKKSNELPSLDHRQQNAVNEAIARLQKLRGVAKESKSQHPQPETVPLASPTE